MIRDLLEENGIAAIGYHGQMDAKSRRENQEKWMVANPFAEALGYSNCKNAVVKFVSTENQNIFEKSGSSEMKKRGRPKRADEKGGKFTQRVIKLFRQ